MPKSPRPKQEHVDYHDRLIVLMDDALLDDVPPRKVMTAVSELMQNGTNSQHTLRTFPKGLQGAVVAFVNLIPME